VTSRPRPLQPDDGLASFDCGDRSLNDWLARIAQMAHAGRTARVFVTCDEGRVVGYYALAAGHVALEALPGRMRRGAPTPVAIAVLARLAVDRSRQGEGLGLALLSDAARRTLAAAEMLGVRALVVHAASARAASFYERAGFTPSPSDPLHLAVLLKDLERRYGRAD